MNLLTTSWGRLAAFFLLYITEGLPFGFALITVVTAMKRGGLDTADVGWFGFFITLPWTFKLVFGPMVDLIGFGAQGHRRGWILIAHAVIIAGLGVASQVDPAKNFALFTAAMIAVNGFCALQDVAIDALAVSTLRPEERGLGNGLMFAGAYVGQFIGGGVMQKVMGATGGLTWTFPLVALGVAVVTLTVVLPMREAEPPPNTRLSEVGKAMGDYANTAVRAVFGGSNTIAALVFALLPAGAFALGMVISTTIGVELGLSDNELGNLTMPSTIVAAIGCVVGGVVSDKLGHRRMLAAYIVLTIPPTLGLAWAMADAGFAMPLAAGVEPTRQPDALINAYWAAVLGYSFISGLAYGTRSAIFMQVCDPKVAATQFTAYMSGMNIVIAYTPLWQGEVATRMGYTTMFALDIVIGMLCLAALAFITPRDDALDDLGPAAEPGPQPIG